MFSGTVRTRDRLRLAGDDEAKVAAISFFERGSAVPGAAVAAGQIGTLRGLDGVSIGDAIDLPPASTPAPAAFAPPRLETVIVPDRPADKGALHAALAQLAEQDPLIGFRQDARRQELSVSLYGEVQKEVVQATLADDYGHRAHPGGRVRLDAVLVLPGRRGDGAGGAARGAMRMGGDRLQGRDEPLRLCGDAEPLACRVRQEHFEHGA
jgi:hypothetical protein